METQTTTTPTTAELRRLYRAWRKAEDTYAQAGTLRTMRAATRASQKYYAALAQRDLKATA